MNTSLADLSLRDVCAPTHGKSAIKQPTNAVDTVETHQELSGFTPDDIPWQTDSYDDDQMTVFLIDDDESVRDALTLLLRQSHLRVESFGSGDEFLKVCHAEMLGCAIIDFNMPGMNGIQLQEALIARAIPLPVIFLTGDGDIPLSVRAIKAGASDFLTKPVPHEKLLSSIATAFRESVNLLSQRRTNQQSLEILSALTRRENDVMKLALEGQTSKKIAITLGISHRTVEIHKARLMKKTGAENILDLARIVQDAGVTTTGHEAQDQPQCSQGSKIATQR